MIPLLRGFWIGLRRNVRRPGLPFVVVATWGLASSLVFVMLAVLHAAWIQPVDVPAADRLVDVLQSRATDPDRRFGMSPVDQEALSRVEAFEDVGVYLGFGTFDLVGEGAPVRLDRHLVTAGFFSTYATPPEVGRTFTEVEVTDGDRVVVLSHRLWQGRFGGDRTIVGREIRLDGESWTVLGVMPRGFGVRGGLPDLWAPLGSEHRQLERDAFYLGAVARLAPGSSLESARQELDAAAIELARRFPDSGGDLRYSALPLVEVMRAPFRSQQQVLVVGALFVLAIAGVDVAGLLLARGLGRRGELRIRRALGERRARIAGSLVAESAGLALVGGGLGALAASIAVDVLPDLRGRLLHDWVDLAVHRDVALAGLAAVLVLGLLAGLPAVASALRASRERPASTRSASASSETAPDGERWHIGLVLAQVALSMLLLTGATMALRSLALLGSADLGVRTDGVVAMRLAPSPARAPDGGAVVAFTEGLLERLRARPEIRAAGIFSGLPGEGWSFGAELEGRPDVEPVSASWSMVDPGAFGSLGLEIVEGRSLRASDRADGLQVLVVDETLARRLSPTGSVLGETIRFGEPRVEHRVVGVVRGARTDPRESVTPTAYLDYRQRASRQAIDDLGLRAFELVVQSSLPVDRLIPLVRSELDALDPDVPLSGIATMDERLAGATFRPRFDALVLSVFAALAVALAAIGLYGTLRLQVTQRRAEWGIRLALGARPGELERSVLGKGLARVGGGVVLGSIAALALHEVLQSVLFGLSALDPRSHVLASLALLSVAALACWLPARRIRDVDPATVLSRE